MTVAFGLVCSDGVLVASDSMGSNRAIAEEVVKVHSFQHNPVVWTAAGAVYVSEEVELVLADKVDTAQLHGEPLSVFGDPQEGEVRKKLKDFVIPSMRTCYKSVLGSIQNVPAGQMYIPFPTDFLFLGWGARGPWFIEISQNGEVNSHTATGFFAVGSGGEFANVCRGLMRHYIGENLTLEKGKLLAYRAIETTCDVSSGLVGKPVQIAVADEQGARVLTYDDLKEVRLGVQRWKELELESLMLTPESAREDAVGDLPTMKSNDARP